MRWFQREREREREREGGGERERDCETQPASLVEDLVSNSVKSKQTDKLSFNCTNIKYGILTGIGE